MALKDIMKSLIGKKQATMQSGAPEEQGAFLTSESFPIIPASAIDLNSYRKVPLVELAALGSAFSALPEAIRTITQEAGSRAAADGAVYVGVWPKGVDGRMVDKGPGFSGNIIDQDGKIVGRMRFKKVDNGLPATNSPVIPFNPMTVVIAAALVRIDQKLDALEEKAEEILQFLTLEKQSRQRGNLNMLAEIMQEYKRDGNNEKICALRVIAVQDIKREAYQNIFFYQEQIARKLKEQNSIHSTQKAQALLEAVIREFYEYQLSCYLYAYTCFLEIMLQKNFDAAPAVAEQMSACAGRYRALYADCRAQIAHYQRTAIEAQLIGNLGNTAKAVGQKMAIAPVSVKEKLISAGESLGNRNKTAVAKKLEQFAPLEDSRMGAFIDDVHTMSLLYSDPEAMITDGDNLYVKDAQSCA